MSRETTGKGNLSEARVLAAYVQAGFTVLLPFGGGAPYDLVVDTGRRLLKVQVKTGRLRGGCVLFPTMRFSGHKLRGKGYTRDDIDLFAVYCPDNDLTYAIPLGQLSTEGRLRCGNPRNNQGQKIRWAKNYEFELHIEVLRKEVVELRGFEPLTS